MSEYNSLMNQLELKNVIINQKSVDNALLTSNLKKIETAISDLQLRYDVLKAKNSRVGQPRVSGKFTKKKM